MASEFSDDLSNLVKQLRQSSNEVSLPPSEVVPSKNQRVLPNSLFKGTRGYIENIVFQINHTYDQACYDACAVMIRRLVEVLIIETFESHNLSKKIKDANDNYLYLQDLIAFTLAEPWNLGRNTKAGLSKLKTIGDQSAHSRRYNARREYIDDIIIELRTVAEEFLYLSGLKK